MAYTKLNTFHLFAGAGGGILGDLLLGHNPIGACEIEPYPRDVLLARQADGHLPDFPIWDDVATLDGNPWRGSVDVLCGGFPCQDISAAGTRNGSQLGIEGKRSGLWKEYARLIGEMRPRFVFAENSPNLRTRGLVTVLKDIASMGYDAKWCVLGAGDIKAPHQRKRMWVLAYPHSKRFKGGLLEEERAVPTVYDNTIALPPRSGWGRLGGKCATPVILRSRNDVPSCVDRLKAIGNAQVPGVAATAFNILSEGLL